MKYIPCLRGVRDKLIDRELIFTRGKVTFNENDLILVHRNPHFMENERFIEAYDKGRRYDPNYPPIHWRLHTICWAAKQGLALQGDFIEFGVNNGFFAETLVQYTNFSQYDRKLYLVDTFEGMQGELLSNRELSLTDFDKGNYNHDTHDWYPQVRKRFEPYPNVEVVKGAVPGILASLEHIERLAYVSIDMNCTVPEIAAAEFCWDRMPTGAVIVLDDYGFTKHTEQRDAFDAFTKEKGIEVMLLATGQGIIVKP